MRPEALLFDLDGTLTDPAEGIFASILHACERLGVAAPEDADLPGWIGPPLLEQFAKFLGIDPDNPRASAAVDYYREHFSVTGLFENRVYAGIDALLCSLKNDGFRLLLATSKPEVFAKQILQHFGLEHYFAAVYGSMLDGQFRHKPDLIARIMNVQALKGSNCLMIGDRDVDIIGAKANGLSSIGVLWGYGDKHELESAGADRTLERPDYELFCNTINAL